MRQAIQVRPAQDAEVQLTIGRIRLFSLGAEAAEPYLLAARNMAPENPEVYECLAELAGIRGNDDEAATLYDEAAARGSQNYLAQFYPAMTRAKPFLGAVIPGDHVDSMITRELVQALKRAVAMRPALAPGYELIGGLMGTVGESQPSDFEVLQAGALMFPNRVLIRLGLMACDLNAGRHEAAEQSLVPLMGERMDDETRAYATKLEHRINGQRALAIAENLLAEGRVAETEAILPELLRFAYAGKEHQRLDRITRHVTVASLHERARTALARNDWSTVEVLLAQLKHESVPASLQAAHDRLMAEASNRPVQTGP
jgi:tetratricopeptide (TPR) repeat protein